MRTFLLLIAVLIGNTLLLHAQDDPFFLQFGDGVGFTEGFHTIETSDGGHLLIGSIGMQDLANAQDPWIIKLDVDENTEWEYQLDFAGEGLFDLGFNGIEVDDGYIILGNYFDDLTFSNFTSLTKLDTDGQFLWSKVLDNYELSDFGAILAAESGSFIIGGVRWTNGEGALSLAKFDADGEQLWMQAYPEAGRSGNLFFECDAAYANDGGIFLTAAAAGDALLLKTDTSGNLLWQAPLNKATSGVGVEVFQDGGIVVLTTLIGLTSPNPKPKQRLIHLDSEGNIVDSTLIDTLAIPLSADIAVDDSDNIYLIGNQTSSFRRSIVIKTNRTGDTLWTAAIPVIAPASGVLLRSIEITSDHHVLLSGSGMVPTAVGLTPAYFYLAKLKPEGCIISSTDQLFSTALEVETYPIPAIDGVHFRVEGNGFQRGQLQLYNAIGQLLRTEMITETTFYLERKDLTSGNYFYRIDWGERTDETTGILIFK